LGTLFTQELTEGQWIKSDLDGKGSWTKVQAIENDTTLYLTEGYRGENRTTQPATAIDFSTQSSGANRDYILNRSNGQIELIEALVAGDSLTAGSINTRAFVDSLPETYNFDSLGASSDLIVCIDGGFPGTVSTGDGSAPYNNFFASNLIGFEPSLFNGFYIEWISGNNTGEIDFVSSYSTATGELVTISGTTNPIISGDRFILCQVIEFTHVTDFADPENATAQEVSDSINAVLLGGKAEVLINNSVRVRTSNFSEDGKVQIKGGSANQVLALSLLEQTNQLTNLANTVTNNSDREGNPDALGYTVGPDQSLVIILDDDSANKTFSIQLKVEGTTTASGVGSLTDSSLATKYTEDDYFKDFWIYWTSGPNEGFVQTVTSYTATTGAFTASDVFPTGQGDPGTGETFTIVPRTAENIVKLLSDLNTTTFSIIGTPEVTGISGDFVQLSTNTPGSEGKVFVTGGTANSLGISIESIVPGAPVADVTVNSIAGLSKGLLTSLAVDGAATTGDNTAPYNTFIDTSMITTFPGYFTGLEIELLDGTNEGHTATIAGYNNVTGEIILSTPAENAIPVGATYRISRPAFIVDIQGTVAPYTIVLNDPTNSPIDVSGYTPERSAAIRDRNGLNFTTTQLEGVDGYKYFTGPIQKTQWTIDGLDRDASNYPGIGAAGTQFEVLSPVLVKLKLIINVTTEEGTSLSSVSSDVSNAISEYVNSLGVGDDVILSEIVAAAQSIAGVFDVEVVNLDANVVVADGELARIDAADLVVG
jgi:hypothetical protein